MQPVQGIFPAEAGYGLDGVLRAISIKTATTASSGFALASSFDPFLIPSQAFQLIVSQGQENDADHQIHIIKPYL